MDTPLLVGWRDGSREDAVYLFEEETGPPRFSPTRLLRYMSHLVDMFGTDRVVPVVIFLRDGAAPGPLRIGGDRRVFATLDWVECRLASMDAAAHMDSGNIAARLNLPNMRCPPERRVDVYAAAMRGLQRLEQNTHRRAKYTDYVDFYAALTDNEREQYRREYPEEAAIMVGIVQQARNEGRAEGERAVLERQLRRRFGELDPGVGVRLGKASPDELGVWAENVLVAATLDEVFGRER